MSGNINVNYNNVESTLSNIQRILSHEIDNSWNYISQARNTLHEMGGEGNAAALESLQSLQGSEGLIAAAIGHFLQAVGNSARHLQAEENILAGAFGS